MGTNILITDNGWFVNHRLPCLAKYTQDVNVIKMSHRTEDIEEYKVIDVSIKTPGLGYSGSGFESWEYRSLQTNKNKLEIALLEKGINSSWYSDVILLGDIKPESLTILSALQESEFDAEIHLIVPLPFGRVVKGSAQYKILSNLNKVKSLAVYDPYKLAKERYGDTEQENITKVADEMIAHFLERENELFTKMEFFSESKKYFFDFERDGFIETDTLYVLDDYEITHTLGFWVDPYLFDNGREENSYFIECLKTPVPRPDGKKVCEILRNIRKKFARANQINYEFRECIYDGPCAGTCDACDKEARDLIELAKELKVVTYPNVTLEE